MNQCMNLLHKLMYDPTYELMYEPVSELLAQTDVCTIHKTDVGSNVYADAQTDVQNNKWYKCMHHCEVQGCNIKVGKAHHRPDQAHVSCSLGACSINMF